MYRYGVITGDATSAAPFTLGPHFTTNFVLTTELQGAVSATSPPALITQGLLNLTPGATVKTDGYVTNTGAITLLSATLTVTHGAGFGGVIRFLDGNSLLSLGDAQPSATLSGLRAGDQVDLPGVAYAGAGLAAAGNVLGITEGGAAAASLTLADQSALSPASFSLSADAAGGTLVSTTLAPGLLLGYLDGANNDSGTIALDAVSAGAPAYLQHQYIDTSANSVSLSTTVPNVFLHAGSGNDALQAGSGQNVLDAGIGNSFMAGGSGTDTFFVDVRSGYHPVWDTIVNFRAGDSLTVWGFQGGAESFVGQSGAAGYTGATLAVDLAGDGAHTARITLAGLSDAQAGRLVVTAGAIGATPYLSVVDVAG